MDIVRVSIIYTSMIHKIAASALKMHHLLLAHKCDRMMGSQRLFTENTGKGSMRVRKRKALIRMVREYLNGM